MTKNDLRKSIKIILSDNKSYFKQWSESICKQVINSSLYKDADHIFVYMALPDEVDVSAIIQQALKDKKQVYIPRIIPDTNKMDFYKYKPDDVEKGSFGIEEPVVNEADKFDISNNKLKLLVLVPGRGFTKDGKRIGRGKGFYDLYISRLKEKSLDVKIAGICFPCQIIETIPVEDHDILMDKVYTIN